MKTLVFLKTHFINDFVLNELQKMRVCDTKNHKTVLFIDNHTKFLDTKGNGIQKTKFNGKEQECFLYDEEIFKETGLPYYSKNADNTNFSKLMWYCCDYPFYTVQKYYPDYNFYWQIESDVFMNSVDYKSFFQRFKDDSRDLILNYLTEINCSDMPEEIPLYFDWIYSNKIWQAGYFPVVRMSADAIKLCYKKRLEHIKIFEKVKNVSANRWVYCENFVTTECVRNGLKCGSLEETKIRLWQNYDINNDIPPSDGKLYHPIKSD